MSGFSLDTSKYDYMKLSKNYDEFSAPAFKILVEGKDIVQKEYMAIERIKVETSVEEADMFSFNIVNGFDLEKFSFAWDEDYFKPGSKVEIKLGYIDKLKTVIEGVITSVEFNIESGSAPTIRVYGMDTSFLMMKGKKTRIWSKKKHSEIVEAISKNYNLKATTTATSLQFETVIQNGQSDYEFIQRLSSLNGYEFFVTGGNLYFRDPAAEKSPIISLKVGENIISFKYSVDIADQISSVNVKGYNIKKEVIDVKSNSITKIGSGSYDGPTLIGKLNSTETIREIYEPIIDKNEAENIAKAVLNQSSRNFVKGQASTVGIPELRAGRYINVKGMWGTTEKMFYILSCSHEFDDGGFTSFFQLGGNTI